MPMIRLRNKAEVQYPSADAEKNKAIHIPRQKKEGLGTFDFISWWERDKIQSASVMVIGAGALGNEVLKNLSLMGIGKLFIVDFDEIETSNLSRSVLFREMDIGQPKVIVAAQKLKELNPDNKVYYLQADITTDIGLGVFRRMDAVVGCLDNQEARLAVNRFTYRLGKPWIDGAIQELFGLVRVFVPEHGACYECTLTEEARREMSTRFSHPLLARQNISLGEVPSAPTMSSIIGAMQSQEVLKLLHQMPINAGQASHFNGLTNEIHHSTYLRRDDCEAHWIYKDIIEMPNLTANSTSMRAFLELVRKDLGKDAVIELDQDIVIGFSCLHCQSFSEVFRPISRVSYEEGLCPVCGELRQLELSHLIKGDESFLDRSLHLLGVPPLHIIRARNSQGYHFYELTGDLQDDLHFQHVSTDDKPVEKISRQ